MNPLTKPKVDANALETSVLALWQEFLARYFDGRPHAIGATAGVPFPKAELNFQQSAVTQPQADQPAITLVWNEGGAKPWKGWETVGGTRQELMFQPVSWNFWVRANGTNAKRAGKEAAERLAGLLGNSAETRALAQAGITRLKASVPRAVQETDYTLRLVTATATLRYPIKSQMI